MPKQKVEIEVDVPAGYEVCKIAPPRAGDVYLNKHYQPEMAESSWEIPRIILRRVKQYREPVLPADYGKECEFSDDGKNWERHPLLGFCKDSADSCERIWFCGGFWAKHCRIEKESP